MRKLLFAGLGLLALSVALLNAAAPQIPTRAEEVDEDDGVQDLLYVGQPHPLMIRLKLRVEQKSAFTHYEASLQKYFAFLDRNDNKVLDKNEATRAPSSQQMLQFIQGNPFIQGIGRGVAATVPFTEFDEDRDGKVTFDEFKEYYNKNGAGPLTMAATGGGGRGGFGGFNPNVNPNQPETYTDAVFALLDTNKDGKLSRKEIEAAEQTLLRYDADDNEMVSLQEIGVGQQNPGRRLVDQAFVRQPPQKPQPSNVILVARDSGKQRAGKNEVVRKLIERYDREPRDGSLTRDEIPFPKELFASIDRNKDGKLTVLELSRWVSEKPAGEFTVQMRNQGDPKGGAMPAPAKADKMNVTYGGIRINVVPQLGVAFGRGVDSRIVDLFEGIDTKKTGFITRKQLEDSDAGQTAFMKGLFDLGDRNADGRFSKAELKTLLDTMTGMRGAQLQLSIVSTGNGLFQALDANADGRLSLREMRKAWARLSELDVDRDGYVSKDEFPQQYQLTVSQGANPNNFVAFQPGMGGERPPPARVRGPVWFTKMDRNGDGDVSRAEWLGEQDSFGEVDLDRDGLISLEEAEAFDVKMRGKNDD